MNTLKTKDFTKYKFKNSLFVAKITVFKNRDYYEKISTCQLNRFNNGYCDFYINFRNISLYITDFKSSKNKQFSKIIF